MGNESKNLQSCDSPMLSRLADIDRRSNVAKLADDLQAGIHSSGIFGRHDPHQAVANYYMVSVIEIEYSGFAD
jgi:hypothetical protein